MTEIREVEFLASRSAGPVHGILTRPPAAAAFLVLAHGAGAGMHHPFFEDLAARIAARDIANLRWQFPYMEKGQRRPDPTPVLLASVRAAIGKGRELAEGLPLFAGGKSMGGRMTSMAAADDSLDVRGIVFFGFPLHPAGRRTVDRAEHLARVAVPMLFLQGSRDALADLALLRPIVNGLGTSATFRVLEGADHSFRVLRGTGRANGEIMDELARVAADWIAARAGRKGRGTSG